MTRADGARPVAVFDAGLPTGIAAVRSLGRAGVPIRAFDHARRPPGRYSRYVQHFERCPETTQTEEFTAWLRRRVEAGEISLVAPTSDYVTYAVALIERELGVALSGGVGGPDGVEAVLDCLFKHRFAERFSAMAFATPACADPVTLREALDAADRLGYPVVVKPKSHIGVGRQRGVVVDSPAELQAVWRPYENAACRRTAFELHPELRLPLLQQLVRGPAVDCVSVSGYVSDKELIAASTIRKTGQWGGVLQIGTEFEVIDEPPYLDHALKAAATLLGTGIFELELLVDRETGDYWAIELNPRMHGQISLDIERGLDLPLLWYRAAIGEDVTGCRTPASEPTTWRMAVPFYAGVAVEIALGPQRRTAVGALRRALASSAAGSIHSWRDPRPGLVATAAMLKHPGGLLRPYVKVARARQAIAQSG